MSKKRKLARNLFMLVLLILIAGSLSTGSLTSLAAHKRSERTAHYGPSTIIKSQKIKGGMLYLCKYDKWFSLNTVRRGFLGLWYAGGGVHGAENDFKTPIDYTWMTTKTSGDYKIALLYGVVNAPSIKSVKLVMILNGQEEAFEQKEFYDDMFFFTWDKDPLNVNLVSLTGMDENSNIVFIIEKP
jgi:hypothetical protein